MSTSAYAPATSAVDSAAAVANGLGPVQGPQKLGPLTPLVGEWEGDVGLDLSYHNQDDETSQTSYFEKATFKPIPIQENGRQVLWGLSYSMTAWRHGEEAMDPFHDEIGFLLWDKADGQVIRNVVELIIRDGIAAGEFEKVDPAETSQLLMRSLVAFVHPVLISQCLTDEGDVEAQAKASIGFSLRAITPRA